MGCSDNTSLTTAGAIVLSAAVAICISVYHSTWTTKTARTKATYDAHNNKQLDGDYLHARDMFIQARNKGPNGVMDAVSKYQPGTDAQPSGDNMNIVAAVRLIMNDYELMFIAIEEKVLDVEFLKKWHKSTIIHDYKVTRSYVEWIRGQVKNDNLYEVFQRNAEAWEKEGQNNNNTK